MLEYLGDERDRRQPEKLKPNALTTHNERAAIQGGIWRGRADVVSWTAKNEDACAETSFLVKESEALRQECQQRAQLVAALASRNQENTTQGLAERSRDLESFRTLLHREWEDMREELQLLRAEQRRLEKAMLQSSVPIWLASECLKFRTRRPGIENTADFAEALLNQERRLGENIRVSLKEMISAVEEQLVRNSSAKTDLETDWSQKLKANNVDRKSLALSSNAAFPGFHHVTAAGFPEGMSTPEEWWGRSEQVLSHSAEERRKSRNLRLACTDIRERAAKDLLTAKTDVDDALESRINEIQLGKIALSNEICQALDEANLARQSEEGCRSAERGQAPYKGLVTTRLHRSRRRPSYELCRDIPRNRMKEELDDCVTSAEEMNALRTTTRRQIEELENCTMRLAKMNVDHDLALDIDKRLCRPVRALFPDSSALAGYQ